MKRSLNPSGTYFAYLRKSRADREAEAHGEGETLLRHKQMLHLPVNLVLRSQSFTKKLYLARQSRTDQLFKHCYKISIQEFVMVF